MKDEQPCRGEDYSPYIPQAQQPKIASGAVFHRKLALWKFGNSLPPAEEKCASSFDARQIFDRLFFPWHRHKPEEKI
jgi:hypothetical protein